MFTWKFWLLTWISLGLSLIAGAQQRGNKNPDEVPVIIKNGVLHWAKDGKEVALFGVNYTAPFAYAYRAHKALNISPEDAIRNDVYHFARLGFDAFRVHVWDTEISDTAGNLLQNEHLRLFDFLLAELKKYNIKTIVTPIAFWGNGYPEPDENTPGFSRYYGKGKATINDTAIRAQENYLKQFFTHVNPYTGLRYQQDPDIIATEINNEPNHSGPQAGVTAYINRLYAAIRTTGWRKPIFYNISENPRYAAATVASAADGYSFQWYPSGLVSGHTLQGNYLPHVNRYAIPFGDTIDAFKNKPLMVYEFDPADILQPIMYPAMARSFRSAGFQWATQFAYDPMAIAYANTEYQTHYLNLAHTPAKAISMLIAGEVFRNTPRNGKPHAYPADSVFGPFRISYRAALSEMNAPEKFYHSNHTSSVPANAAALTHIAGVGSSPVIHYTGTGAYFLDKIEDGAWRLEVMPDAIFIRDPYEKAAPAKVVSAIRWQPQTMRIQLPSLGQAFKIKGLNKKNTQHAIASGDSFSVTPGTYLLMAAGKNNMVPKAFAGRLPMDAFVAPAATAAAVQVHHTPPPAVTAGESFTVQATVWQTDTGNVTLMASKPGWNRPVMIPMQMKTTGQFEAGIPESLVTPGLLHYRIMVKNGEETTVFPDNVKGNPLAWDYLESKPWEIYVAGTGSDVVLYHPSAQQYTVSFPSWGRDIQSGLTTGAAPGSLAFRFTSKQWPADGVVAVQHPAASAIASRITDVARCNHLVLNARTLQEKTLYGKLIAVTKDGIGYMAPVELSNRFTEQEIPLSAFGADKHLLLPRPYPGFQPLWFYPRGSIPPLTPADIDVIQFVAEAADNPLTQNDGVGFEINAILLRKK